MFEGLQSYIPLIASIAVISLIIWAVYYFLLGRHMEIGAEARLPRQLLLLLFTTVGFLIVLLLIPMSQATRGQVLRLLGIVLTGVIALSSTTFVANAMAGLMLRLVKSFRHGDFIRIGEQFGRVSERGLFHTEIQTEDRDLTTFPNLYLVTNPLTVVRSSGTIISANLSLGYDIPRKTIEELLKKAAEEAELHEPFVLVKELGDFSVTYRIAGFLSEIKQLLTVRSNLRKKVMDILHENGIEIASPTIMNQRRIDDGVKIIPPKQQDVVEEAKPESEDSPEAMIFDKAEEAEESELRNYNMKDLVKRLEELKRAREIAADNEQIKFDSEIAVIEDLIQHIESTRKEEKQ
ncbi:MAG: mechanosensitive ion channel [Proteobacteria bacterium]|nr:mechanosensitive ion channel [Pseudomonadota bacterium]